MPFKKNDFIEIEFTGKIKDGEIFDSNRKTDLDKIGSKLEAKPFIFSLGHGMFLKGIDDFLIGKEAGDYEVSLKPEDAFGNRNPSLIQMIPMNVFKQNNVYPVAGAMLNFDGRVAKILSVSGGRVIADFNNPIAGKAVVYNISVKRKLEDINEKTKSLLGFLFGRDFSFKLEGKSLVLEVEKPIKQFVEMFKDKIKEILELELSIKEIEPLKKDKKDATSKDAPAEHVHDENCEHEH